MSGDKGPKDGQPGAAAGSPPAQARPTGLGEHYFSAPRFEQSSEASEEMKATAPIRPIVGGTGGTEIVDPSSPPRRGSTAAMAAPGAPSPEVPDLDLPSEPPVQRPASSAPPVSRSSGPAPRPAGSSDPADYFGAGTFDEDSIGDVQLSTGGATGTDALFGSGTFGSDDIGDVQLSGDTGTGPEALFGSGSFGSDDIGDVRLGGGSNSSDPAAYFGAGTFDADDLEAGPGASGGSGLELDGFEREGRAPNGGSSPTGSSGPPPNDWPRCVTPSDPHVDAVEVRIASGYGDRPSAWYDYPGYAINVLRRKGPLRNQAAQADERLAEAERRRDAQLIHMVEDLRSTLEADSSLSRALEQVLAAERVIAERSEALKGANAEYAQQAGVIDQQITNQKAAQAEARKRLQPVKAAADTAQHEAARATAQLKRVSIELRGLQQQAASHQAKGTALPPELAQKAQELQQRGTAMQPEVTRLQGVAQAALEPLRSAQADVDAHDTELKRLQRLRAEVDERFGGQLGVREAGVNEAEQSRAVALADAGRAILAAPGDVPVPDEMLAALRGHDASVERAAGEARKFQLAQTDFDADARNRGLIMIGAAAFVLLALIVGMMVGASGGDDDFDSDSTDSGEEQSDDDATEP